MRKKKKKLDGKYEYEFFRWGKLSPSDHPEASLPENSDKRTFHTAPVRKGIYAFPKGYIETFLLGMSDKRKNPDENNNGRCFWLRDDNRKILTAKDVYDNLFELNQQVKPEISKMLKKQGIDTKDLDYIFPSDDEEGENFLMVYYAKVRRFKYSGPFIWHHLKSYYDGEKEKYIVNLKDILDERGSWIKTTMKVWIKALHKSDTIERWKSYINTWGSESKYKNGSSHGNPHTGPSIYSKDHYEVFIEKL